MTHNQIAHAQNVEAKRHNLAFEDETNRHNLATEALDKRRLDLQEYANKLQEQQNVINATHYSNVDTNQSYANVTNRMSVKETARHNAAQEVIQDVANAISHDVMLENARHNVESENIANYNSATQYLSTLSQNETNAANRRLIEEKILTEKWNRASLGSETFKDVMLGFNQMTDGITNAGQIVSLFAH